MDAKQVQSRTYTGWETDSSSRLGSDSIAEKCHATLKLTKEEGKKEKKKALKLIPVFVPFN